MSFSFIHQLLDNGVSEEEILASLTKQIPSLASKASRMFSGGWSPRQVLDSFSKEKDVQKTARKGLKPVTPSEIAAMRLRNSYDNIPKSQGDESKENLMDFTKKAAPIAAMGLGSQLAAPMAEAAMSRALPHISNLIKTENALPTIDAATSQLPQEGSSLNQVANSNVIASQPPINKVTDSIPEPTNIQQPKQNSNIVDKLWTSFEKGRDKGFDFESDAFLKIAKRMKSTGEITSKEDFQKFFDLFDAKKNEGKDLPTALKEASGEFDNQRLSTQEPKAQKEEQKVPDLGQMGSGMTGNLYGGLFESLKKGSTKFAGIEDPLLKAAKSEFDAGNIKSPEDLQKFANESYNKPKPIQKNSTVIAPNGVGEVKEIRNGKAIVEIDGKRHQINEDDLEQEPEDVIQTVQELLQIPEVDRSSIVSLFTYDPEDKQMIIQFHNGESYKYLDVDPEKVMNIANKMGIPVSQGKNIFGAWSPEDKKSLGATLIKEIINDPKYKKTKKGEEANPNYRQMDTLFDYWEKLRKKPKKKKNV